MQRAVARFVAVRRQEQRHQQHRQQGDGTNQGERIAPARPLPEPGGQRVADQDRHGQPHQHAGNGLGAFVRRHHGGSHQHCHAEIGTVGQAGDEAKDHQRRVIRRQGAGEVAQGEETHQQQQQVPAEQP